MRLDEIGQIEQHRVQLLPDEIKGLANAHGVGVELNVCTRRSQVDHRPTDGTLLGKRAYRGHQIVVNLALDLRNAGQINLILMRKQIGQLIVINQPGLVLRGRQRDPDPAEEPVPVGLTPDGPHLLGPIPPGEWGEKCIVREPRLDTHTAASVIARRRYLVRLRS